MIINAYAVLVAFTSALRAILGVVLVLAGIGAWRRCQASLSSDARQSVENRSYLALSLALLLLALNVASWPLFYALLQSYVSEWPGVMCIYGVTRIGASPHNIGPSRFLPSLLTALQIAKPALVFLSGLWLVLYLVSRRTRTAVLMKRLLAVLVALGLLSLADSAAEGSYLLIPKKEQTLAVGCCTVAAGSSATLFPTGWLDERSRPWLAVICCAINGLLVAALLAHAILSPRVQTRKWSIPLAAGAIVSVPVSGIFLTETLAPTLLRLPDHHCVYDLPQVVPESLVGMGLFVLGVFSVGWACAVGWFAYRQETAAFLPELMGKLLFVGLFGYLGCFVLFSSELALR
ncbi:MAG: hypothetical protein HY000_09970 [Planctomycetes bacterium]|nr:hypothetical protein [Planctomycetota bacterium]